MTRKTGSPWRKREIKRANGMRRGKKGKGDTWKRMEEAGVKDSKREIG